MTCCSYQLYYRLPRLKVSYSRKEFWCLQFSQKTNLKMLIFAPAYWSRNFSFVFWENSKIQRALSKLTDLQLPHIASRRVNYTPHQNEKKSKLYALECCLEQHSDIEIFLLIKEGQSRGTIDWPFMICTFNVIVTGKAPTYLLLPLGKWGSKWGDFHWAMGCV